MQRPVTELSSASARYMIKPIETSELLQSHLNRQIRRLRHDRISRESIGIFAQLPQCGVQVLAFSSHHHDARTGLYESAGRGQPQPACATHDHNHLLREPHEENGSTAVT